ncbi:hypothetical protein FPHYL_7571 [Fusarium phyllophilum]|uniref:Uncharacterized protein n=1 Tax=Fusarium phyllophilum TaxID=47803 RepID=A0A8H5N903_9HYPO|nr:hypothetical protein FPHYL_7571 [Fusarium phyllophilum]
MNNQARGNSRRGRFRRGRGQYLVGNMGHPQNGGGPGQAPVPFRPPPPVVVYPAYGQFPYAPPQQPYFYPPLNPPYGPVVYQNAVPLGYYPYAYMPPPPQGQVNQVAQGQAHMPQLKFQANTMVHVSVAAVAVAFKLAAGVMAEAAQVAQGHSSEAGVAERNSLAALPVPLEQSSDLDRRGVKQEDTDDESTLVAQNIGSTEIKREPVIKQEPQ